MRKLRTKVAHKTCSKHRGVCTPLEFTDHSLRILRDPSQLLADKALQNER